MIRLRTHSIRYETGFAVAASRNHVTAIRFRGMFIDEMKRKTKKSGKTPWTASPEPVRSATKAPSAPKPSVTRNANAKRTSDAEHAGGEVDADRQADGEVDRRLDEAERDDPAELAGQQRDAAHRRQRQPVQEAGLDVAGEIGARVHGREERALDERHGEREGDERVVGKPGRCVSAFSPPELTASSISGKSSGAITFAGWRMVRTTERRASRKTWSPKPSFTPRPSRARRLAFLVGGALERAAGLREEDVVERGLVQLELFSTLSCSASSARTISARSAAPERSRTATPAATATARRSGRGSPRPARARPDRPGSPRRSGARPRPSARRACPRRRCGRGR